jgi:hypothetical protein
MQEKIEEGRKRHAAIGNQQVGRGRQVAGRQAGKLKRM